MLQISLLYYHLKCSMHTCQLFEYLYDDDSVKTSIFNGLLSEAAYAVILSKIIFLSAKSHMHIFNMLIRSVHNLKLIA